MRLRTAVFAVAAGLACAAPAQSLDELRDAVRDVVRTTRYPLFVASFLGMSEEAELSGGSFRIDADGPTTDVGVTTFPLRLELDLGEALPGFLFEGNLGYATARIDVPDLYSGAAPALATSVTATYATYGGYAAFGPRLLLGDDWELDALVGAGYARVESDARYGGPGAAVTAALLDGILFNWDADYLIYGGTLLLRREVWHWGSVTVAPELRYDLRRVDPLAVDDAALDEADTVQWLVPRLAFEGPTGWSWRDGDVAWVASLGGKVFDRDTADAIGFGEYLELSAGLRWECQQDLPLLSRVGLNAALFYGDDVRGWTIGMAMEF